MVATKNFRSSVFLTCCILGALLSSCTTLPDFLKPAVPETGDHDVYRVLEKNVPTTARKYVGIPYKWGADPDTTSGSDCSHLITAVTRNSLSGSGFRLYTTYFTTEAIKKNSYPVEESNVRVGDIVFFREEDGPSGASHAGIVTCKKGSTIFFVQASSAKGVIETSTGEESWRGYWLSRFDSYRRWKASVFAGI